MKKALVIEDDANIRSNLEDLLHEEGFEVISASDGKAGVSLARRQRPDVVLCDILLPEIDGYGVLGALRADAGTTGVPFLFLTAKAEKSDHRLGMNLGADDYITKPFSNAELVAAIRARMARADEVAASRRGVGIALAKAAPSDPTPIVRDASMIALFSDVDRVATSHISVLLLGETGAGKEVVARAIHDRSPRAGKPFVAVNAAALPETLVEAELFGHVKGAFTHAAADRAGLFEAANGGTLFLDELGEMPITTQGKLLRVLQEREVTRIGANKPIKVDVRFLAATNRDLDAEVAAGRFREDLFYRLNAITLEIPPLRERPDDILPLANSFLASACAVLERAAPPISDEASARLLQHAWPGNVRDLKNTMERALVFCGSGPIEASHLGLRTPARPRSDAPAISSPAPSLLDEQKALERRRILEALERCSGNLTKAAEILGVSRRTLTSRVKEFAIPRPRDPIA